MGLCYSCPGKRVHLRTLEIPARCRTRQTLPFLEAGEWRVSRSRCCSQRAGDGGEGHQSHPGWGQREELDSPPGVTPLPAPSHAESHPVCDSEVSLSGCHLFTPLLASPLLPVPTFAPAPLSKGRFVSSQNNGVPRVGPGQQHQQHRGSCQKRERLAPPETCGV